MTSTLSLALIICLVASALPVAAQQRAATADPLARAVTREAARLAAVQSGGTPAESNWSRVRKLAPGTEITVTLKGSPPVQRAFLTGDDSDLTVLNVTDPELPAAACEVLRGVASSHPEYFPSAQQGGRFVLERSVRMGPEGVFAADRKVADLEQVVEKIARNDVAEIKTRQKGRGVWGHLGPLGGYFVGAMSGGYVAGFACQAAGGRDRCDNGAFLMGGLVGGIAGGVYGLRAATSETEDVIYRAP